MVENLLSNGDFSAGNTGFSSDYTFVDPQANVYTAPPTYSVIHNPATDFTNPYDSYGDHTDGTGLMLFVDGAGTGSFWSESLSLAANTSYTFTYYVTGADSANLPTLQASLNGTAIGSSFAVTADGGGANWQQVTQSFTTTTAGTSTLALMDLNGAGYGNDFTVDDMSLVATCYCSGTLIRTIRGEVAVEHLVLGDHVITAAGERRPIRWIGTRTVACTAHTRPHAVWPVRVAAHAFGENRPARDLFVSPDHALCVTCVDEVLIPASRLLNGSTIARHPVDSVTYWHIELDTHDILLANGLPAESYLDVGNRSFFAGAAVVTLDAAPGDGVRTHADFCRPFVDGGPVLDIVRSRLGARAAQLGWRDEHQADLHLAVDGRRVDGLRAGDAAVFLLPSGAMDVRLVSDTFVPDDFNGWGDRRGLGVAIRGLSLLGADGQHRRIELGDPRLAEGLLDEEMQDGRPRRWTAGSAALASALWDGLAAPVVLRVELEQSNVRACQAPGTVSSTPHMPLRSVG